MNKKPANPGSETEAGTANRDIQVTGTKDPYEFRVDPRRAIKTQALVSIPSLRTRAYILREMSRSGMFLAFGDRGTCRIELEQYGIECGTHAEIAFVTSAEGAIQRCNVRGQIVRITREGMGVAFLTHNPPQLAQLRGFFSCSESDVQHEEVAKEACGSV